jgi:CubicO group peptidase (beta-lactamase class C family)
MKSLEQIDLAIHDLMQAHHIVGLSACRVQDGEIVWSNGYGWADIANHRPMTPDVIQNIGSISKTFTCTALMQLWEKGLFQLDDPVNDYLPFKVHHPQHPVQITFRQLLTHTAAIEDGPAYSASYACGDPTMTLGDWLHEYFLPEGKYYDPLKNFKPYAPGESWSYSNVAFGLLGYLGECLAGEPFHEYCKKNIFQRLGMNQSGWMLSDIDLLNHAVPYALPEMPQEWRALLGVEPAVDNSEPAPLCLYSFPNYPDGLVRTSARQLAFFAAAFSGKGERLGYPVLQQKTVERCFTRELVVEAEGRESRIQGLTWGGRIHASSGLLTWGHDGGDPGVNTRLRLREDGAAITILANSNLPPGGLDALENLVWEAA